LLDFLAEIPLDEQEEETINETYISSAQSLIDEILNPKNGLSPDHKKTCIQNMATTLHGGVPPITNVLAQVEIGKQLINDAPNSYLLHRLQEKMDETRYALSDEEKITQTKWLINSLSPGENPLKIPEKKKEPSYLDWAYNAIQPAISVISYLGTLAGAYGTPDPEVLQREQCVTLYETTMLEAIKESKLERHCHAKDVRPVFELPRQKLELKAKLEAVPDHEVQGVFEKILEENISKVSKLDKKYQGRRFKPLRGEQRATAKKKGKPNAQEQRKIGRSTQGGPTKERQPSSTRSARRR